MFSGRGEGEEQYAEETGDSEDYTERGGHAHCFEGAVGDTEADEVSV